MDNIEQCIERYNQALRDFDPVDDAFRRGEVDRVEWQKHYMNYVIACQQLSDVVVTAYDKGWRLVGPTR